MKQLFAMLVAAVLALPAFADGEAVAEAITDYMDFATEADGIILPQQLTGDVFQDVFFVDVRSPESYAAATIKGAINIGWREVPGRLGDIPETGMVVLFCDTGVRSAQATFAARLMGRENVVVLQSGFTGWQDTAAYKPE